MFIPVSETNIKSTLSFIGMSGSDGKIRKFRNILLRVDFISSMANLIPKKRKRKLGLHFGYSAILFLMFTAMFIMLIL